VPRSGWGRPALGAGRLLTSMLTRERSCRVTPRFPPMMHAKMSRAETPKSPDERWKGSGRVRPRYYKAVAPVVAFAFGGKLGPRPEVSRCEVGRAAVDRLRDSAAVGRWLLCAMVSRTPCPALAARSSGASQSTVRHWIALPPWPLGPICSIENARLPYLPLASAMVACRERIVSNCDVPSGRQVLTRGCHE
jgi:hypothetical protein